MRPFWESDEHADPLSVWRGLILSALVGIVVYTLLALAAWAIR